LIFIFLIDIDIISNITINIITISRDFEVPLSPPQLMIGRCATPIRCRDFRRRQRAFAAAAAS